MSLNNKTLAYDLRGDYLLLVHTEDAPDAAEFDGYLALGSREARRIKAILVVSEGGAPDARQRKQMQKDLSDKSIPNLRTAVITPSSAARLVVNLISWTFAAQIRAFPPGDVTAALNHLVIPESQRPGVLECVDRLRAQLKLPPLAPSQSQSAQHY